MKNSEVIKVIILTLINAKEWGESSCIIPALSLLFDRLHVEEMLEERENNHGAE